MDKHITGALQRAGELNRTLSGSAVDALGKQTAFATRAARKVVGTRVVDAEERPVHLVPYPVYAQPVERLRVTLGRLGLFVQFDWMPWDGLLR